MTDAGTRLFELLKKFKRYLIVSQADPDGDSVGSQLALQRILLWQLRQQNVQDPTVEIVNEVACPGLYDFLPEAKMIRTPNCLTGEPFDVGFVLDCGVERAGSAGPLFEACQERVWIDHHRFSQDANYTIRFVNPDVSSTCEVVYENLVESEPWRTPLDKAMAEQLYAGIIFDTGLFRHSNTRPKTHEIAARLISTGIDFTKVVNHVFYTRSFVSRKLLGRALTSLQRTHEGKIVWAKLQQLDFLTENATEEDCADVIGQLMVIEGAQVALFFRETQDGKTKVSFRSRGMVNVGQLAAGLDSGGGGHSRASGCTLQATMDDAMRMTLAAVEKAFQEANPR